MGYDINGFKSLKENSIDAVFLGPSQVLYGISPMKIYQDTGIKTYSLASPDQQLELTYGLLEMVFRTQNPKVVFLEATGIFSSVNVELDKETRNLNLALNTRSNEATNNYWYYVFDELPIGIDKFSIIKEYARTLYHDNLYVPIFPIFKFHGRWTELTEDDFIVLNTSGLYYSAGESNGVGVVKGLTSIKQVNEVSNYLIDHNIGFKTVFADSDVTSYTLDDPVYQPIIFERTTNEILRIRDLCVENGAELVFIKIPQAYFVPEYRDAWSESKATIAKQFCNSHNIELIDLIYDLNYDVVNFDTDSYDGGIHLNTRGAEKVSIALEPFIKNKIKIPNEYIADFESMKNDWLNIRKIILLQSEMDFYDYINMISDEKERFAIFIASSDDYCSGLTSNDYSFLCGKLNLKLIQDGVLANSYIAIIDRGMLLYEELSDRKIEYKSKFLDTELNIASSGTFSCQMASIELWGKNFALSNPGLNIVIYDYQCDQIIDFLSINTQDEDKIIQHGDVTPQLIEYESKIKISNNAG